MWSRYFVFCIPYSIMRDRTESVHLKFLENKNISKEYFIYFYIIYLYIYHIILLLYITFKCICVFPACTAVNRVHAVLIEVITSLRTGVTNGWKSPNGCWKLNLGLWKEQPVLLTTDLSPTPSFVYLFLIFTEIITTTYRHINKRI